MFKATEMQMCVSRLMMPAVYELFMSVAVQRKDLVPTELDLHEIIHLCCVLVYSYIVQQCEDEQNLYSWKQTSNGGSQVARKSNTR